MSGNRNKDFNTDLGKIAMMSITDDEFNNIRKLVYDHVGINLTDRKRSLVVGRLQKLLKQMQFTTFKEYYQYLIDDKSGKAFDELANRISTNYTFFYREKEHFDFLTQSALPDVVERKIEEKDYDLRVWCAAAASGEEPYSLGITLLEYFGKEYVKWDGGVLATDISADSLSTAVTGIYSKNKIKNIPKRLLNEYFLSDDGDNWIVEEKLKREITYRRFNLMNEIFPFKKAFDIIFCRNVMIYFDEKTRSKLIEKLYKSLAPGGYLFVGHSESLGRNNSRFKYIRPAVYKKDL